jgi:hypothetical protein
MDTFLTIAERLGIPFSILVMVMYGAWKAGKWLGREAIVPITKSHIELIGKAKETNETNALTLAKMAQTSEVTGQAIVRIADQHEENLILTRKIHDQLIKRENTEIRAENAQIRAENAQMREANKGDPK